MFGGDRHHFHLISLQKEMEHQCHNSQMKANPTCGEPKHSNFHWCIHLHRAHKTMRSHEVEETIVTMRHAQKFKNDAPFNDML